MGFTVTIYGVILIHYLTRLVQSKALVAATVERSNNASTLVRREADGSSIPVPSLKEIIRAILRSRDGYISIDTLDLTPTEAKSTKVSSENNPRDFMEKRQKACSNMFRLQNNFLFPTYFVFFGLCPTIITVILRILLTPAIRSNCFGCEVDLLDVLLFMFIGAIIGFINYYVIWAARKEPDPLGIRVCFSFFLLF